MKKNIRYNVLLLLLVVEVALIPAFAQMAEVKDFDFEINRNEIKVKFTVVTNIGKFEAEKVVSV